MEYVLPSNFQVAQNHETSSNHILVANSPICLMVKRKTFRKVDPVISGIRDPLLDINLKTSPDCKQPGPTWQISGFNKNIFLWLIPSGYDIHSLPWLNSPFFSSVNHLFRLGPSTNHGYFSHNQIESRPSPADDESRGSRSFLHPIAWRRVGERVENNTQWWGWFMAVNLHTKCHTYVDRHVKTLSHL